jgi:carboxyl-terminal processing protease
LKNPEEYKKLLAPQKPKETSSLIKIDRKPIGNISLKPKNLEIISALS